jgi:hypothetical protein
MSDAFYVTVTVADHRHEVWRIDTAESEATFVVDFAHRGPADHICDSRNKGRSVPDRAHEIAAHASGKREGIWKRP